MAFITIQPEGAGFPCEAGDTILRAALRAGLGMPYSCNVGSCGNCRFELVEGSVEHIRKDAPAWTERDLKRNRWLGCQALPQGDCRIKFRTDPAAISRDRPARRGAELVTRSAVTRDITEFAFRIEGDDGFRPGQYALLYAPGVEGGRPYSMSNLPGEGIWRFLVKKTPDGAATGWLFDAKPGARVTLDGPYGTAWLRAGINRDLVLLAGGSGLSPMVAIAHGALAAGMLDRVRLHFFYGARGSDDLFDPAYLGEALTARIDFTEALSDPVTDPDWQGHTGFLHEVVEKHMGDRLKDCEIYFAGPAAMSGAVQKMAYDNGVPMSQLHFDEFY